MIGSIPYAILDLGYVSRGNAVETTRNLIDSGADLLQLRAKGCQKSVIVRVVIVSESLTAEDGKAATARAREMISTR